MSVHKELKFLVIINEGIPGGSVVKNPPAIAGLIPGLWRSPAAGNANPLQSSCLGNSMD